VLLAIELAMTAARLDSLVSAGPHPSLGAHAETYGRLIGDWSGELRNHMRGDPPTTQSIEIHFAWVLDGRAIQDVWITPARGAAADAAVEWYGTTLRVFDPTSQMWHATWHDPASRHRIELEGKREGDDIVQLGMRAARPIRWVFSKIRRDSFAWHGSVLNTDGITWDLEIAIAVRRA
jgi:hypothetical protein